MSSKKGKWTKAYQKYRERFYAEKKLGNVKVDVRILNAKTYKKYRTERDPSVGRPLTDREIIDSQTMLHGKGAKTKSWKDYLRIRKTFQRGQVKTLKNKYIADIDEEGDIIFKEEENELFYHYNLRGLLHDKHAIHMLITGRILEGEDRKEVLADYGY